MKIYLIGSNGFLGSNLQKWFQRFGEIRVAKAFNRNDTSEWQAEVLNDMVEFEPEIIFIPGASQDIGDDEKSVHNLIASNCLFPALIAQRLVQYLPKSKLVVFGTSWQYSDSDSYRPCNLYAASKQAGQDLLTHYALQGLKILSLILFDTYSENDNRVKLYRLLQDAIINNVEIGVTHGEQEIDLVHIDDICSGVELAITELDAWDTSQGLLVLGLGSGAPITVKELIRRIGARAIIGARPYRNREVMKVYRKYNRPKGWSLTKTMFQDNDIGKV
jgi:nucleoside-diphosphate-sugar epimerase